MHKGFIPVEFTCDRRKRFRSQEPAELFAMQFLFLLPSTRREWSRIACTDDSTCVDNNIIRHIIPLMNGHTSDSEGLDTRCYLDNSGNVTYTQYTTRVCGVMVPCDDECIRIRRHYKRASSMHSAMSENASVNVFNRTSQIVDPRSLNER